MCGVYLRGVCACVSVWCVCVRVCNFSVLFSLCLISLWVRSSTRETGRLYVSHMADRHQLVLYVSCCLVLHPTHRQEADRGPEWGCVACVWFSICACLRACVCAHVRVCVRVCVCVGAGPVMAHWALLYIQKAQQQTHCSQLHCIIALRTTLFKNAWLLHHTTQLNRFSYVLNRQVFLIFMAFMQLTLSVVKLESVIIKTIKILTAGGSYLFILKHRD